MKISEITKKVLRKLGLEPERDYYRDWVSEKGRQYRMDVYERQKERGAAELVSNPTIDEIKADIGKYSPEGVLEIGCGWGRIMNGLRDEFKVEGCDCSKDMLDRVYPGLKTFYWDVVAEACPEKAKKWDVLFCRGVFQYVVENKKRLQKAFDNTLPVTGKAFIIYEWPEVLDEIRKVCEDGRLVLKPIKHLRE
ncbi:MAG: class I SAM-dependent methyltransferase [Endomicrobiales bacterium]|nr:class I SAM-dependent methyltransferase [Endomicrobiales bacterium]